MQKKYGNILIDKKNEKIIKYFFEKKLKSNFVEIGYMIIKKIILPQKIFDKEISFNDFINKQNIKKKVNYFINESGYLSISDNKRYEVTKNFFKDDIILVDRDGVLNKKNKLHRYVRNIKELKINNDIIKKYRKILIKKKVICITNQAGISTGDLSNKNLLLINKNIKRTLKKSKIDIIDFFVSKHHFKSKNIDRKPGAGLFFKAAQKYKFILDKTTYIGDDIRDIEASYNAKCKCIYVGNEKLNYKQKKKYRYILTK